MLLTQLLDFIAHIIYTVALLLCRVSGLAFYHRLCSLHSKFRIAIQVVFGVLVAGFLPQIFLLIFHCSPVTGYWPYDFQPEFNNFKCLEWGLVYSVNSAVSLLCDLLIFGIPIAMLWTLEMNRKKKVQLGSILLPGILYVLRRVCLAKANPEQCHWYFDRATDFSHPRSVGRRHGKSHCALWLSTTNTHSPGTTTQCLVSRSPRLEPR